MPDRKHDRMELKRLLVDRGKSLLLLAPRRIGKTWTMLRLEEDAADSDFHAVFYDAQKAPDPDQFFHQLNQEIGSKLDLQKSVLVILKERLKELFTRDHKDSGLYQILGKLPPRELLNAYLKELDDFERPTVIMIDEIAIFALRLHKKDSVGLEQFLSELREFRLAHPNTRWLLTGSIGLDWVAKIAGVEGTLNDLKPFHFLPFNRDAARKFIDDLTLNGGTQIDFRLDNQAFDYLVKELGWLSPYYIEAIADEVEPSGNRNDQNIVTANQNDIQQAFINLLRRHNRNYFSSWKEHINKNIDVAQKDILFNVLKICARDSEGEEEDTILTALLGYDQSLTKQDLRTALDILMGDGYLSLNSDTKRITFRSGLLRQWWWHWICHDGDAGASA